MTRAPTWREYRVLDALMHLESRERPITISMLAKEARLDVTDAGEAVTSLVARGFLDMGAVPPVEVPRLSPQ